MSKHEENRLKKIESLKKRECFLKDFKNNIETYGKDSELLDALSTQTKWSKFSGYNFISMSKNGYEYIADKYLYDGYKGLDGLRISALKDINDHLLSKDKPPRTIRADTKEGMNLTIKTKDSQLSIVREANLVLSKAIEVTVDALDKLAKETKEEITKDIIEAEMSKVKSLLRRHFKLRNLDTKKTEALQNDKT